MPLIVGNLLTDQTANSWISVADADAYLAVEGNAEWSQATEPAKEAALVNSSRWLAYSLPWCSPDLTDDQLTQVGYVAARLAVQALTTDLWAAEGVNGPVNRYKADTVEIQYFEGSKSGATAGGKSYPWVYPMLRGMLCGGGAQHDVARR